MSRTSVRQFGGSGNVDSSFDSITLIERGIVEDGSTVTLTLEEGSFYLLYTKEYNASTGAYRGHRLVTIVTPEGDLFGTTANAHVNSAASSNSGITINYPNDSTVTMVRSSSTYSFKYVLYKL